MACQSPRWIKASRPSPISRPWTLPPAPEQAARRCEPRTHARRRARPGSQHPARAPSPRSPTRLWKAPAPAVVSRCLEARTPSPTAYPSRRATDRSTPPPEATSAATNPAPLPHLCSNRHEPAAGSLSAPTFPAKAGHHAQPSFRSAARCHRSADWRRRSAEPRHGSTGWRHRPVERRHRSAERRHRSAERRHRSAG